eukprot:TRINITY_DN11845_c0_g1_i1.p2 TRINITY_DN11845_c0_g1~~TRINITY_DN11845_c0_g1_i1.p2  ORF type:complete len:105 (-),score=3.52 TRINITY_DN11845_c0_g1_i1:2084-2398(-)
MVQSRAFTHTNQKPSGSSHCRVNKRPREHVLVQVGYWNDHHLVLGALSFVHGDGIGQVQVMGGLEHNNAWRSSWTTAGEFNGHMTRFVMDLPASKHSKLSSVTQ